MRNVRRSVRGSIFLTLSVLLVACPLPFQFTPEDTSGAVAASNDPANPLVTAAPELFISERTTGSTVNATPSTIVAVRDIEIVLASETRGALIFYTTDGSDPSPGDAGTTKYNAAQPIVYAGDLSGGTINAVAIGPGMYPSLVTNRIVTVDYSSVATPVFTPDAGDYSSDQQVTISTSTSGATIYYTIADGVDGVAAPVPGSPGTLEYTGPISVSGGGTAKSISAIATASERKTSAVASAVYTIGYEGTTEDPVFSLRNGLQGDGRTLTISSPTPGAVISYTYTTDGSEPPAPTVGAAQTYTGPVTISGSGITHRFRAIARASAYYDSDEVTATFVTVPRITVTTTFDDYPDYSGTVMLREAILAANDPGNSYGPGAEVPLGTTMTVIDFDPSLGESFTISLDPVWRGLEISANMVIEGDPGNPGRVAISGGGAMRIFSITAGDVTLRDLTIRDGAAVGENGGGSANDASGGGGGGGVGGAIYVTGSATNVTIENTIIRDNAAGGGRGGNGGQIFSGNFTATGQRGGGGLQPTGFLTGGGAGGAPGAAGGIGTWLGGGGAGGSASSTPGVGGSGGFAGGGGGGGASRSGGNGAAGGASAAFGGSGGVGTSSGTAGGGGGAGLGGAIFVAGGSLEVRDSEFLSNLAAGGAGGGSLYGPPNGTPGAGQGGAIFVYSDASFTGTDNVFSGNEARNGASTANGEPDVYIMN